MTNPIFIIHYQNIIYADSGRLSNIGDMNKLFTEKFPELNVLAIPLSDNNSDWKFEMFNGENISEIEFEELKKKVFESVEELELK